MARNELNKAAMEIADVIYRKFATRTDADVAREIGIDPSTLCRFKTEHLGKFCACLAELGLTVVDVETADKEREALLILAQRGLESMRK